MSTTTSGQSRRRRSRPLLTLKSKKSARKSDNKEVEVVAAEFGAMPCVWNSFTIDLAVYDTEVPDGFYWKKTRFRRGDEVLLNSKCDGGPDVWVGRISQIRTTADRSKMLIKVRWFYSRNDVAEHIKSFDTSTRSPYERIFSDYYDYLSPRTLQGVTYVHEYDESVLDPLPLQPTDFFMRSTLQLRRKLVKPPLGEDTCRCQVAYNPYPQLRMSPSASFSSTFSLSSEKDALMHFCPRLGCRKWYHASCLQTMGHIDTDSPPSTRGLRLLAVDPYSEIPYCTFAYFSEQESAEDSASADKHARLTQLDIYHALEMFGHSTMIVAHLPPSLLAVAQSPIVRCSGAPDGWAIGNVADVVLARRFVYAAIEHSGPPEATEAFRCLLQSQEDASPSAEVSQAAERTMIEQLIEGLEGFDLLASVHAPYWERRWRQFLEMQVLLEGPAFECPQCKSAI